MALATVRISTSPIQGRGVFALDTHADGDALLAIDDSHRVDRAQPLPPEDELHLDFLAGGQIVLMQPPECYINHSCDPNVFTRTQDGVRYVVARRAIRPGEELTFDYSINGSGDTVWTCGCHSSRCRHKVHSDFFHLPVALQYEYLPLLEEWFRAEHDVELQALAARLGPPASLP